jgi:hypothetical protein
MNSKKAFQTGSSNNTETEADIGAVSTAVLAVTHFEETQGDNLWHYSPMEVLQDVKDCYYIRFGFACEAAIYSTCIDCSCVMSSNVRTALMFAFIVSSNYFRSKTCLAVSTGSLSRAMLPWASSSRATSKNRFRRLNRSDTYRLKCMTRKKIT